MGAVWNVFAVGTAGGLLAMAAWRGGLGGGEAGSVVLTAASIWTACVSLVWVRPQAIKTIVASTVTKYPQECEGLYDDKNREATKVTAVTATAMVRDKEATKQRRTESAPSNAKFKIKRPRACLERVVGAGTRLKERGE
jgi:hypothetical protein